MLSECRFFPAVKPVHVGGQRLRRPQGQHNIPSKRDWTCRIPGEAIEGAAPCCVDDTRDSRCLECAQSGHPVLRVAGQHVGKNSGIFNRHRRTLRRKWRHCMSRITDQNDAIRRHPFAVRPHLMQWPCRPWTGRWINSRTRQSASRISCARSSGFPVFAQRWADGGPLARTTRLISSPQRNG